MRYTNTAESGGFEPPGPARALRFSRPVHSTALPTLHNVNLCIALELFRFLSSQNFFWNDSTDFHQHKFQKKCLGSSLSHLIKLYENYYLIETYWIPAGVYAEFSSVQE